MDVNSWTLTFYSLSDVSLGTLLGVKSNLLCGQKFNVKIEDFRFVGFPVLLEEMTDRSGATKSGHKISSCNVAFVLQVGGVITLQT